MHKDAGVCLDKEKMIGLVKKKRGKKVEVDDKLYQRGGTGRTGRVLKGWGRR